MKKLKKMLSEIEKKVLERYPVTKKEKNCRTEKCKMDWLRAEYKKELNEQKEIGKRLYESKPEV